MSQRYLHLSTYACAKCQGPVVAGWFGQRETSITREAEVARLAGVCLSCGDKTVSAAEIVALRHFPAVAWGKQGKPE